VIFSLPCYELTAYMLFVIPLSAITLIAKPRNNAMSETNKVSVDAVESFRPFARVVAREVAVEKTVGNEKVMFLTIHDSGYNEYDSLG
jgi:predicted NodU family carbamoyl transferase